MFTFQGTQQRMSAHIAQETAQHGSLIATSMRGMVNAVYYCAPSFLFDGRGCTFLQHRKSFVYDNIVKREVITVRASETRETRHVICALFIRNLRKKTLSFRTIS